MWGSVIKTSETVILAGNPEIELVLRPSTRARRLSLRVSRLDGRVTLTLPKGISRREAMSFANERADWIRKHLADTPIEARPEIGGSLLYLGVDTPIIGHASRRITFKEGALFVPENAPDQTPARLAGFLKAQARTALVTASTHYANMVDRDFGRITIRDTRSRWGSCSSDGNLMYSWRLIMADPEVLDYVAAHEVAHLVHMDHSSAFWNQVEEISPNYRIPRKWLRDNGSELHRYKFRD